MFASVFLVVYHRIWYSLLVIIYRGFCKNLFDRHRRETKYSGDSGNFMNNIGRIVQEEKVLGRDLTDWDFIETKRDETRRKLRSVTRGFLTLAQMASSIQTMSAKNRVPCVRWRPSLFFRSFFPPFLFVPSFSSSFRSHFPFFFPFSFYSPVFFFLSAFLFSPSFFFFEFRLTSQGRTVEFWENNMLHGVPRDKNVFRSQRQILSGFETFRHAWNSDWVKVFEYLFAQCDVPTHLPMYEASSLH